MERIEFGAMGTQILAVIDRDGPTITARIQDVPEWFETWEQCLSRFRPDSELSLINASAGGRPSRVSRVMGEVLLAAEQAARLSEGLVTPLVLEAMVSAGYNQTFDHIQLDGMEIDIADEIRPPDSEMQQWMNYDHQSRTLHLASGAGLDLGGIAKGWAADRAAARLGRLGPAMVDAGGDIAVSRAMSDGEPWLIGVSDPFHPSERIDMITIASGGVATSGKDRRVWQKNGVKYHHIIDPRTGRSAETDVYRATVIGPSARLAEMAAKVVVISGSSLGLEWLDERPEYAGLLILDDGELVYNRRWVYYSWR